MNSVLVGYEELLRPRFVLSASALIIPHILREPNSIIVSYLVKAFSKDWLTENIYHANAKIHPKLMKIALTLPLTSTSAERAFSKLKLVKSRLRTTMHEARKAGKSNVSVYRRRFV